MQSRRLDRRRTWTALVQEDTASWARPANTLASTQRYSFDRQSSVCCTGGYQLAYALGELSLCSRHAVSQGMNRMKVTDACCSLKMRKPPTQASRSQCLHNLYCCLKVNVSPLMHSQHLLVCCACSQAALGIDGPCSMM